MKYTTQHVIKPHDFDKKPVWFTSLPSDHVCNTTDTGIVPKF